MYQYVSTYYKSIHCFIDLDQVNKEHQKYIVVYFLLDALLLHGLFILGRLSSLTVMMLNGKIYEIALDKGTSTC